MEEQDGQESESEKEIQEEAVASQKRAARAALFVGAARCPAAPV
jgi:hypothetical protein